MSAPSAKALPTAPTGPTPAQIIGKLSDLIRLVMRWFYEDDAIVIVDLLLRNPKEMLRDADVANKLNLPEKLVRTTLNYLTEQQVVHRDTRQEARGAGQTQQFIYYIDFKRCLNMIRYRIHCIQKKLTPKQTETTHPMYSCPSCQRKFTTLDAHRVLDFDTGEMRCDVCKIELVTERATSSGSSYHTKISEFNTRLKPVLDLLKELENVKLPAVAREIVQYDKSGVAKSGSTARSKSSSSGSSTIMDPLAFSVAVDIDRTEEVWTFRDGPLMAEEDAKALMNTGRMQETEEEDNDKEQPPWLRSKYEVPDEQDTQEDIDSFRSRGPPSVFRPEDAGGLKYEDCMT